MADNNEVLSGLLGNPLFQLGANLLAGSGPSTTPRSFGGLLGDALGKTGQQTLQFANAKQKREIQQQQLDQLKRQNRGQGQISNAARIFGDPQGTQQQLATQGVVSPQGRANLQNPTALLAEGLSNVGDTKGLLSVLGIGGKPVQDTNLVRNVEAALDPARSPEFRKLIQQKLKGGPLVSINNPETAFPPAELAMMRDKDGKIPPVGLTPSEARAQGVTVAKSLSGEEAKQITSSEIALNMLDTIDHLVNVDGLDVGSEFAAKTFIASSPWLSWMNTLTPKEAKLASNLENVSNVILAAVRGAQVGPKEKKLFDKQLARGGQDRELFKENLALSQQNLRYMAQRIVEIRAGKIPNMFDGTQDVEWAIKNGRESEITGGQAGTPLQGLLGAPTTAPVLPPGFQLEQ